MLSTEDSILTLHIRRLSASCIVVLSSDDIYVFWVFYIDIYDIYWLIALYVSKDVSCACQCHQHNQ